MGRAETRRFGAVVAGAFIVGISLAGVVGGVRTSLPAWAGEARNGVELELDARWRGRAPIDLAPSALPDLLAWLYAGGGRNLEVHLMQVRGAAAPIRGVVLPTSLPETP